MNPQIQSVHFDADAKLLEFIQKKVDKLQTFYDNIIDGEVILRIEKASIEKNKTSEIMLNIPGNKLFAKEVCKSFEEATDLAVDSLHRQIMKHKEKVRASNGRIELNLDEMAD